MKEILFVNHKIKNCGVYQFGFNTFNILKNSTNYNFNLAEVNSNQELIEVLHTLPNLSAIIYNYYPSTMSWLSDNLLLERRKYVKQLVIKHETGTPKNFDAWVHIDPKFEETDFNFKSLRPIQFYNGSYKKNKVLTFGSFGFGFGNKGFPDIVNLINSSFDSAKINFLIPFAHFGDIDGKSATNIAKICKDIPLKSGIELNISHDFLNTDELLSFLAGNDLNIFMYGYSYGRGISSVLDYALGVKRPLALTKSWQFRHLYDTEPSIFLEDTDIHTILHSGTRPLERYYLEYSHENFIKSYERILDNVL